MQKFLSFLPIQIVASRPEECDWLKTLLPYLHATKSPKPTPRIDKKDRVKSAWSMVSRHDIGVCTISEETVPLSNITVNIFCKYQTPLVHNKLIIITWVQANTINVCLTFTVQNINDEFMTENICTDALIPW